MLTRGQWMAPVMATQSSLLSRLQLSAGECLSAHRGSTFGENPEGTWLTCGLSGCPVKLMHRLHSRATVVGPNLHTMASTEMHRLYDSIRYPVLLDLV
jgi:hypothetical protein